MTAKQIDSIMPTYRVYAFHATGDSVTKGGVKRPVLRAQTTFGYWVDHDGELQGWKQTLTGATLIRLNSNWYKVTVPNGGVTQVTSTIQAMEPKRSAFALHGGLSFPLSDLKNAYDRGFGISGAIERRINGTFALAALVGYHRFDSVSTTVSGATPHLEVVHLSGILETTLMASGPLAVSVDVGAGMYRFQPGNSKSGAHAGVGFEYAPSLRVELEISARVHNVSTGGSSTRFAAIQAGARVMF